MRILFVAMPNSIHTTRWINQVSSQPWDIHLFPAYAAPAHEQLRNTTFHPYSAMGTKSRKILQRCRYVLDHGMNLAKAVLPTSPQRCAGCQQAGVDTAAIEHETSALKSGTLWSWKEKVVSGCFDPAARLARVIRRIKPDIIHSLEIQHAGYLTREAQHRLGDHMPPWIVSNWGSDIYLFGRDPNHAPKIRSTLAVADYYGCECQRDVGLGQEFGFEGLQWPVVPSAGGYHLDEMESYRQPGPTSQRRVIALKGYHGWAGRALVGLQALTQCADVLKGYEVHVYNAYDQPAVQLATKDFTKTTGIASRLVPKVSHDDMLRLHGQARASIGLSISDGISTSFLEALIMGSLPIQSYTACADEWIEDGKSGLLVPPEDATAVALAIRRALTDDTMVDRAAQINADTARRRLEYKHIQQQVIALYKNIAALGPCRTVENLAQQAT